jgi:acylphosphatase
VLITGRVQGVWFRQSCADQARLAQVHGWVRNRPDGRVEAVFEGDERALDAMVAWCWVGPPLASVSTVEVVEEEPEGLQQFSVRGYS